MHANYVDHKSILIVRPMKIYWRIGSKLHKKYPSEGSFMPQSEFMN